MKRVAMAKKTFQEDLVDSIRNRSGSIDPKDLLEDIFKTYVAKMMEQNVLANKNRMETGFLLSMKGFLISEFRAARLEHQMSESQYSALFDATVQEIFNEAAHTHDGEDKAEIDENRSLNIKGAFEEHLRREQQGGSGRIMTQGGIILP